MEGRRNAGKTEHFARIRAEHIQVTTLIDADGNPIGAGPGSVAWGDVTSKPTEFPPEAHTHTKSDITDFAHVHAVGDITGLDEQIRDVMGVALVQGTGITITVNDGGDTITISSSASLTGFTAALNTASPNNTNNVSSITASGGSTRQDVALVPKGTGGVLAAIPDSAITGGNVRGANAVDWQTKRGSSSSVASGDESVLLGGDNNLASGTESIAGGGNGNRAQSAQSVAIGGSGNTASNTYGVVLGGSSCTVNGSGGGVVASNLSTASGQLSFISGGSNNEASALYSGGQGYYAQASWQGSKAYASGRFSQTGDAQAVEAILRTNLTSDSATELFLDGPSGSSQRLVLSASRIWAVEITLSYADAADNIFIGKRYCAISRDGSNNTALIGSVETIGTDKSSGTPPTFTIDAENTFECLRIQCARVAGQTGRAMAYVRFTQLLRSN